MLTQVTCSREVLVVTPARHLYAFRNRIHSRTASDDANTDVNWTDILRLLLCRVPLDTPALYIAECPALYIAVTHTSLPRVASMTFRH